MKRIIAFVLVLLLCLSLFACGTPSPEKLTELLCDGGWETADHILRDDSIGRELKFTYARFYSGGTCEFAYENYIDGKQVDASIAKYNWKIEETKIIVDADIGTIYLEYSNKTLIGDTAQGSQFVYTHMPYDGIAARMNQIVRTSVGLEYEYNDDGTCIVTGKGTCEDKEIIIPAFVGNSMVVGIGDVAFGAWSITGIVIPDTVTYIGQSAFLTCKKLTGVTIGSGVATIKRSAFAECSALRTIVIPEGVTELENGVFMNCTNLSSVTLPSTLTRIGSVVFCECRNLKRIDYTGSKEQWKAIELDDSWSFKSGIKEIQCS